MDRYVPPTNFWGPRFYRKIMPENCLKWDQKPVSTVEKSPIFVLKPVFTMLQTKSRPAFRDFCGENPARTGGTYLSDLIGECPPPPGAGRRMHFRDVSTCGVCMCFCVCGFVKKFWRVIQNYFQLKKQVPQTLPHILPHIVPHMGYRALWPDPYIAFWTRPRVLCIQVRLSVRLSVCSNYRYYFFLIFCSRLDCS